MTVFKGKSGIFKTLVIFCILTAVLVIVCGLIFTQYAIKASDTKIYPGVKVGFVNLGNMNESDAIKALQKNFNVDNIDITVNCEEITFNINSSSIALKADYEATAKKALSYGKTGSVLTKIKNMQLLAKKPYNMGLVLLCNNNALQYVINEKLSSKLQPTEEYSVEIGKYQLVVSNGKNGRVVLLEKILNSLSDAVTRKDVPIQINVNIETIKPKPIDADTLLKEYNRKSKNAYVEENNNGIIIIPEIVGVEIDSHTTRKIIKDNINSSKKYSIPAKITYPTITAKILEEEYTDTVIATYSTNYNSGSRNRKTNIHLASEKINGIVLNPGEVFSFNNVVGPRNGENGYKMAKSYSGSKVVEDLGGGICQVSSTLYNAAVFADLEIIFRTNHTMPVSYTPLGRDATVSYESIDFKFKNNKETPIKIEVLHDGAILTVNLYGRKKYIKDISIESEIVGTVPFSITEIEDKTMPPGETKVEEAGANGTIVQTFKVIKENGVVVSRTPLAKSTYTPRSKIIPTGSQKNWIFRIKIKHRKIIKLNQKSLPLMIGFFSFSVIYFLTS